MSKPTEISQEAWDKATERRANAEAALNDPNLSGYDRPIIEIVATWDDCHGMARLYDRMLAESR